MTGKGDGDETGGSNEPPVSVPPEHPDDHALDADVVLVNEDRLHRLVRRLEPDPPVALAVDLLHRRRRAVHHRDHHLAVVGVLPLVDDHEVAVADVGVDHRLPLHLEHVMAPRLAEERLRHGERLAGRDGLDRHTGGDGAEHGQLNRARVRLGREDLDRAALVVAALDVPLPLEVAQVFVNRRERVIVELVGDLLEARRVAVGLGVAAEVVQDLALTLGERHWTLERGGPEAPDTRPEQPPNHVSRTAAEVQGFSTWSPPVGVLGELVMQAYRRAASLAGRRDELARLAGSAAVPPSFEDALRRQSVAVIAEVKRRSPSKGEINPGLSADDQSVAYADGGAAALSILTEPERFGGSPEDLVAAAGAVRIPILKKDFHVDPVQILEARALGAAAVLVIARALAP